MTNIDKEIDHRIATEIMGYVVKLHTSGSAYFRNGAFYRYVKDYNLLDSPSTRLEHALEVLDEWIIGKGDKAIHIEYNPDRLEYARYRLWNKEGYEINVSIKKLSLQICLTILEVNDGC